LQNHQRVNLYIIIKGFGTKDQSFVIVMFKIDLLVQGTHVHNTRYCKTQEVCSRDPIR